MSVVSALVPMITAMFSAADADKRRDRFETHLRRRVSLAAERVAEAARGAKGNETQLRDAVSAFEAAKSELHEFLSPPIVGELISEEEMLRREIDRQRRRAADGAHAPEHHPIGQVR